jgi:hypothetical protein
LDTSSFRDYRYPSGVTGRKEQIPHQRSQLFQLDKSRTLSGAAERQQPALSYYAGPNHQGTQYEAQRNPGMVEEAAGTRMYETKRVAAPERLRKAKQGR